MKLLIILLLFIPVKIIFSQTSAIEITISDIRNSKGYIKWAIVDNEKYFNNTTKGFIDAGVVSAKKGSLKVKTKDIPDGKYAISIFHDENDNSKVDFNIFGLPVEGFGFSNNPKIYFGPPKFDECTFTKKGETKVNVIVKYYL